MGVKFNIDSSADDFRQSLVSNDLSNQQFAGDLVIDAIPLEHIELDPDNKRTMILTLTDAINGIKPEDPKIQQKKEDVKHLESLSKSIKEGQQINPVLVYRFGNKCRLIAGERRTLAAAIAGHDKIIARITQKKPDIIDIRVLQWVENHERQDLSLAEKIASLEIICDEYYKKNTKKLNRRILANIIKSSEAQAKRYLMVLDDKLIKECVAQGNLTSFRIIEFLYSVKDVKTKKHLISAIADGAKLDELLKIKNNLDRTLNNDLDSPKKKINKEGVKIGTLKPDVARLLVKSLLNYNFNNSRLQESLEIICSDLDSDSTNSIQKTLKNIITTIEKES